MPNIKQILVMFKELIEFVSNAIVLLKKYLVIHDKTEY